MAPTVVWYYSETLVTRLNRSKIEITMSLNFQQEIIDDFRISNRVRLYTMYTVLGGEYVHLRIYTKTAACWVRFEIRRDGDARVTRKPQDDGPRTAAEKCTCVYIRVHAP